MRVLTATKETQMQRSNDFFFAEEGELVILGSECDDEKVDGKCGCRRAMVGVRSHKSTTTMIVSESNLDEEALKDIVRRSLTENGWLKGCPEKEANEMVDALCDMNRKVAETFPVGTVIERRGVMFGARVPRIEIVPH